MIKRKNKRYLFLLKEKEKENIYIFFNKSIHFKFILRNFKIYLLNNREDCRFILQIIIVLFSLLIIILEIIKKTTTLNTQPLLFPYSNPQQVL